METSNTVAVLTKEKQLEWIQIPLIIKTNLQLLKTMLSN